MTATMKEWVTSEREPLSFYELLGRPLFDPDHKALLSAIQAVNRDLLHYQNHADRNVVRRAQRLIEELGRARAALDNSDKLRDYQEQVARNIRRRYAESHGDDPAAWKRDELGLWLQLDLKVPPERIDHLRNLIFALPKEAAGAEPGTGVQAVTDTHLTTKTAPDPHGEPGNPDQEQVPLGETSKSPWSGMTATKSGTLKRSTPGSEKPPAPSRKGLWLMLAAGLGGIVLLAGGGALALFLFVLRPSGGTGEGPAPTEPSTVGEVKAPSKVLAPKLTLQMTAAAALKAGAKQTLTLMVDRTDCAGAVLVQVHDQTQAISAPLARVAPEQSQAELEITAAPSTADKAVPVIVTAQLLDGKENTPQAVAALLNVSVFVQGVTRTPAPAQASLGLTATLQTALEPGKTSIYRVTVYRVECKGPVTVTLAELPPKVRVEKAEIQVDAEQTAADFALAVDADAETTFGKAQVTATLDKLSVTRTYSLYIRGKPTPSQPAAQLVSFETVDYVQLRGSYYPSLQGKQAPCAILLHNVSSTERGTHSVWRQLALDLQKKGFAVLTFDFRGHGGSTQARQIVGGKPTFNYRRIESFESPATYYPVLANDIAAAKLFLDRKNDLGECNSANLVLIGEGEGATLGALWLGAECLRYRNDTNAPVPEGLDVAGALWLGLSPNLSGRDVQKFLVSWWLDAPARQKRPMAFFHVPGDRNGEGLAQKCLEKLREHDENGKLNLVKAVGTAVRDGDPFKKDPFGPPVRPQVPDWGVSAVQQAILGYVQDLQAGARPAEWKPRDLDKASFVWKVSGGKQLPAKSAKEPAVRLLPLNDLGVPR